MAGPTVRKRLRSEVDDDGNFQDDRLKSPVMTIRTLTMNGRTLAF